MSIEEIIIFMRLGVLLAFVLFCWWITAKSMNKKGKK
jgi:flagellar biogenesis protein FliO